MRRRGRPGRPRSTDATVRVVFDIPVAMLANIMALGIARYVNAGNSNQAKASAPIAQPIPTPPLETARRTMPSRGAKSGHGGFRVRFWTNERLDELRDLVAKKTPISEIQRKMGCSLSSVHRGIKRLESAPMSLDEAAATVLRLRRQN